MHCEKLLTALIAACSGGLLVGDIVDVPWNSAVRDGNVTDAANWGYGTHLPGEGEKQLFGNLGGDYVFRVPSGVDYVSKALLDVNNPPTDGVLTFDVAGTWLQDKATYDQPWTSVRFACGSHFFTPEGDYTQGQFAPLKLDNALLRTWRDGAGTAHLEISRGLVNTYDAIAGEPQPDMPIMFGGDYGNARMDLVGGTLRAGTITHRGGTIMVNGGDLEVFKNVGIANAYNNRDLLFDVSNGTVTIHKNVYLGQTPDPDSAKLVVEGTGVLNVGNTVYVADTSGSGSREGTDVSMTIRESGAAFLESLAVGGNNANTVGRFFMYGDGRLDVSDEFIVGRTDAENAPGYADIRGSARVRASRVNVGVNAHNQSELTIGGHAEFVATTRASLGRSVSEPDSTAVLRLCDNAKFVLAGTDLYVRSGASFLLEDAAEFVSTNATLQISDGCGSYVEFKGGRSVLGGINVFGNADSPATNLFRVSGGDHRAVKDNRANVLGMVMGRSRSKSCFEMTGGRMAVPRLVLCGNSASDVESATFRMTGGDFEIYPLDNSTECDLNVADATGSRGGVELLGGTLRVRKLLGWTGAGWRGGGGWARLYADGGTIAPQHDSSAEAAFSDFVAGFDEAWLGPRGLVLDASMFPVSCNQAFDDAAAGVTGRVVKTGLMPFTVYRSSYHGETVVAGGRMTFDNASVTAFGRCVVVTNGATVSLAGAATALTAERIVLGDASTKGTLEIDLGDVVTLTGVDAFAAPNGFVKVNGDIASVGEWDLFSLGEGATISGEELARVHVRGGDSSVYDYSFALADGRVKLVSTVRVFDETAWTGAESVAWNAVGNWTAAVPGVNTAATFPAVAPNRAITLGEGARSARLAVGGLYSFDGGSLSFEQVDVADGARLAVASELVDPENGAEIVKLGTGELVLGAASPALTVDWSLMGGRTVAAAAGALGGEKDDAALSVGPATLALDFTGVLDRDLVLNAGDARAAILSSAGDVVVTGSVVAVDGGLAKTGAGSVTLELPVGTHVLASGHMGSTATPNNRLVLPANGDAPAAQSAQPALGGLTAVEGRLRIHGRGKNLTRIETKQYVVVGPSYEAGSNPILEVGACYWKANDAGYHTHVGCSLVSNSAATEPTLILDDGAYLDGDCLYVGCNPNNCGGNVLHYPTLAVTNAQAVMSWEVRFGGQSYVVSRARLGDNALLQGGGGGFLLAPGEKDIVVDGGSVLRSPSSREIGIQLSGGAWGALELKNGGTFEATRIGSQWGNKSDEDFVFRCDGGRFVFNGGSQTSIVYYADRQWIETTGAGAEIDVAAGATHELFVRIAGTGGVTKTGPGTLVFRERASGEVGDSFTPSADKSTADFTGLLKVEQGEVRFESADAIGGALRVAGAGDVDFGGASGLDLTVVAPEEDDAVPTLKNVSAATVRVDLDADAHPRAIGDRFAVARLGVGASVGRFVPRNYGKDQSARLSVVDGVVYATVEHKFGFGIIFR